MANYTHLFFDLDDTLWDFKSNAYEALSDVFSEQQLNRFFCDFEQFYQLYEPKNKELWAAYGEGLISKDFLMAERFNYPLRCVGVSDDSLALYLNNIFLKRTTTKTQLVPDAIEVLDELRKRNYTLVIVSNGFKSVQYQKLINSGLIGYFHTIVLSEEVGFLKPDERVFQEALVRSGALPEQTLMIGDNYETDILGAQKIGITSILLAPEVPFGVSPKQVIDNLKGVFSFL